MCERCEFNVCQCTEYAVSVREAQTPSAFEAWVWLITVVAIILAVCGVF